jgi:hypothetical protein
MGALVGHHILKLFPVGIRIGASKLKIDLVGCPEY